MGHQQVKGKQLHALHQCKRTTTEDRFYVLNAMAFSAECYGIQHIKTGFSGERVKCCIALCCDSVSHNKYFNAGAEITQCDPLDKWDSEIEI